MLAALDTRLRSAPFLLPALLLTFVTGLLPFTADYLLFHPDERHYADAGIRMLQTGEYLTPRTADGELRLKKPILPYWCVALGFQMVGISPLGARLAFLVCGAAVVTLAWWGALIAFDSRRAACFAAVAAMTQPALLISAPRSVPDVCLALGIQLGTCGFLLILRDGRASTSGLLAAFGGTAIAVLSKGLPGAAFAGFALLFLAWRSPALLHQDWRRWTVAIFACLVLSGSWFALMSVLHRDELARQFAGDQLGLNRFAARAWQPVVQLPLCLGLLVAMSGPWLMAATPAFGEAAFRSRLAKKPQLQLLLGWIMIYCGLAATINHVTPRYLLPAAAPLSIVIGGLLAECDADRLRLWLGRVAFGMMSFAIATLGIVGIAWSGPRPEVLICIAAAAIVGSAAAQRARRWPASSQALLIAVVVHAALCTAGFGWATWRTAGISGIARNQLSARSGRPTQRIIFAGEAAQASQIRVALRGAIPVLVASSVEQIEPIDVLIVDERRAAAWDLRGRSLRSFTYGHHIPDAADSVRSLLHGELAALLRRHERRYVIAGPQSESWQETPTASATSERTAR